MSNLLADAFASGVTFSPSDNPVWFDRLVDEVLDQRQATLVGLSLRVTSNPDSAAAMVQFASAVQDFAARPAEHRATILQDPVFMIWLMRVIRLASRDSPTDGDLLSEVAAFESHCTRALAEARSDSLPRIGGSIPVQRFDVHPLLAAVAPPTYTFPDADRAREINERTAYSVPFFVEAGSTALSRIADRWAALAQLIPQSVRLVVHVPDGEFRSASAARYTGVVFLTSDDGTLLDLEESIVHEYGHQLLYRIMELDPIVADQAGAFSLPWSGATRDFYGYFHAFCIYILLAQYFALVIASARGHERERALARLRAIGAGIQEAVADFPDDRFTDLGRQFLRLMRNRARELTGESPAEVGA